MGSLLNRETIRRKLPKRKYTICLLRQSETAKTL